MGAGAVLVAALWGAGGAGAMDLRPATAAEVLTPARENATGPAKAQLRRFASCDALGAHMRRHARRLMGPSGIPTEPVHALPASDVVVRAAPADAPVAAPEYGAAPGASSPTYSGTNVQEAGVGEPDIATTDGRTLYSLSGQTLRAVDVSGDAPRVLGALDLTDLGAEGLLLIDGRLVVVGQRWRNVGPTPGPVPMPMPAAAAVSSEMAMVAPGAPRTTVAEVDVTDPARMRVLTTIRADGRLVAARDTAGTVRLVISDAPGVPGMVAFAGGSRADVRAARRANLRAVNRARAGAWLPRLTVRTPGARKATTRVAVGCRSVSAPRTFSGLSTATVLTLRLGDTLRVIDSDAVLTDADTVYASRDSLYVATPRWVDPGTGTGRGAPRGTTLVHRFDTSDPAATTYRASGAVRGYPLNQFSLSEHEGTLRIATTEQPSWWDGPRRASESFVTVLAKRGGRLARVGQVGGLGRGERIYAVRFMGTRGYVVTFRQTDPLYSLDLSDPAAPRVTGELKINGYSAYLHPVDESTLIGIGQDATAEGRTLGTQVSLFDVADPADPRRIAQRTLGRGWSEAESDHHAVLYWPATGLLAVPLAGGGDQDGAVGLTVTRAAGIAELGRITHGARAGAVRRAVVVGDALYTVSDAGVKRSALADLSDRGWAPFT